MIFFELSQLLVTADFDNHFVIGSMEEVQEYAYVSHCPNRYPIDGPRIPRKAVVTNVRVDTLPNLF